MVDFQSMERYGFQNLEHIMTLLRGPGGCPWDREQTHRSIRRNMLEEAYEAAEAIDQEDPGHLMEELGDVLLQVVFHACIAREEGWFTLDDVVDGVCKKLVFRHPHVFGQAQAGDAGEALSAWDAQKRREKGQRSTGDALDSVARSLPALMRAEKLQDKAAKAGFDWTQARRAADKLDEEVGELKSALRQGSNVEEELGDALFAAVKVGRFAGLDSEQALHAACEKFIRRFRDVEEQAQGRPLTGFSQEELERMWTEAKKKET